MIKDEDYMNIMSRSEKKWDMRIKDLLKNFVKSATLKHEDIKLTDVIEVIQTVCNQSDIAFIHRWFLVIFLHVAVKIIRDANKSWFNFKRFSRKALVQIIELNETQISEDFVKTLRADERIARLFKNNVNYVFSLKASIEYT